MPVHSTLRYFNIRGQAEHIRWMFLYAGVPFEDIRNPLDYFPTIKDKYWTLPCLEHEGKKVLHLLVIARYLAREFDMIPKDNFLEARADEVVTLAEEVRFEYRAMLREKDEAVRVVMKQNLLDVVFPNLYTLMNEKVDGLPGKFIVGDKPSWHDFYVVSSLDIYADNVTGREDLVKYPALKGLLDAVFDLPAIKNYVAVRTQQGTL